MGIGFMFGPLGGLAEYVIKKATIDKRMDLDRSLEDRPFLQYLARGYGFGANWSERHAYAHGENQGKIQGYVDASEAYESKLKAQAEHFMEQKKVFDEEKEEYEDLLAAYKDVLDNLDDFPELQNKEVEIMQEYIDLKKLEQ